MWRSCSEDAPAFSYDEYVMAKTYRNRERAPRFPASEETFRCVHCKLLVGTTPSGGRHRNHCPYCLYSRHVDERTPGDRASACGASMAPVAYFLRPKGEQVLVHRCLGCGFERYCRIAADDSEAVLEALPEVEPRHEPTR